MLAPPAWVPQVARRIIGRLWPWARRWRSAVKLPDQVAPVTAVPGSVGAYDALLHTAGAYDARQQSTGAYDRLA